MANESIRNAAHNKRIRMWEIADMLNVSENTLYRKMRYEMPLEEQQRILRVIDELSKKESE